MVIPSVGHQPCHPNDTVVPLYSPHINVTIDLDLQFWSANDRHSMNLIKVHLSDRIGFEFQFLSPLEFYLCVGIISD